MQTNSKITQFLLGLIAVILIVIVVLLVRKNNTTPSVTDSTFDSLKDFQVTTQKVSSVSTAQPVSDNVSNSKTYIYKNHGFQVELPKGFIPNETESEGGPYISMNLPDFGQLVYVTNVSFVKNLGGYCAAFAGQGTYVGKEKFGTNSFDHWSCTNGNITVETYVFEQGNIAYVFMPDNGPITESFRNVMETFKYIGFK